jgi:cystathionine gamma-synthase
MKQDNHAGFTTRAVHEARGFAGTTGAVMPPVFLTSTFESGNPDGFDYTRSGNPNFRNLQATLASLENAKHCTVYSSGVASITAIVANLSTGDTILSEENIYGATYRLFEKVLRRWGIKIKYANLANPQNYSLIEQLKPSMIWLESPTNPMLKILDIAAISKAGHAVGSTVVVDNTFASSFLQRPLDLGADLSQISTTKYTNGHSDCLGGAVCANTDEWQEKLLFSQKALGLNPSPFDAWLVSRGAKTEALRMERHSSNALEIATRLEQAKGVKLVRYPFLKSHPQYELAKKQMSAGSGMLIADLGLGYDQTLGFLKKLKLFTQAESLGGIESLVAHPASMTHASIPKEAREAVGITDGLIRLSVGIEDVEDLWEDISQAIKA